MVSRISSLVALCVSVPFSRVSSSMRASIRNVPASGRCASATRLWFALS